MYYHRKIEFPDDKTVFNFVHGNDFENANPEDKLREQYFFPMIEEFRREAFSQIPLAMLQRMSENDHKTIMTNVFKSANNYATLELNRLKSVKLPEALISIFQGLKKKQEQELFRDLLITPEMFMALLIYAGNNHSYLYSFYSIKHYPKGTSKTDVPRFAYKDDEQGKIFSTDDTTLSEGQVKSIIGQTGTTIVKFLDNGTRWHCFFLTYKRIAGMERDHAPHMHYLSSSWGFTREEAFSELKKKSHNINSVHVWYDKK